MKRGDLVTVAVPGDFGKLRPAVVIQSDAFSPTHPTLTILLMTSELSDAPLYRITVKPTEENGLMHESQVMIDKTFTVWRDRVGRRIGCLQEETLLQVNRALTVWLGIA